jgi:hypothetical protein
MAKAKQAKVTYRDVANSSERDQVVSGLISQGFIVARETEHETQLTKPKKFGPREWMAVLYGFICFIIPALVYIAMWSAKPPEVVIVRITQSH